MLSTTDGSGAEAPVVLFQDYRSVVNAGVGVEYWLGGATPDQGRRFGGTALYGGFATDFSASAADQPGEAPGANQDLYHLTAGTAFSVGRNRFSLGVTHAFGGHTRDFAVEGLPPEIPVIGASRRAEVRSSRWVFVVGYLFSASR